MDVFAAALDGDDNGGVGGDERFGDEGGRRDRDDRDGLDQRQQQQQQQRECYSASQAYPYPYPPYPPTYVPQAQNHSDNNNDDNHHTFSANPTTDNHYNNHPDHRRPLPAYYADLDDAEIAASFGDFDTPANHRRFQEAVRRPRTRNFVVDFGDEAAWAAVDLSREALGKLVRTERPPLLNTRWIHIWMPYAQKEILYLLAEHYDFTPRLLGLMCSEPLKSKPPRSTPSSERSNSSILRRVYRRASPRSSRDASVELEKAGTLGSDASTAEPGSSLDEHDALRSGSLYHIADAVWHWSTIDWGRQFVCLGYNSLYNVETNVQEKGNERRIYRDLPKAARVWNWLILCEDKTVISIAEDPFPHRNGMLSRQELKLHHAIRCNLYNIFRQLSKAHDFSRESALTLLPIRHRIGNSEEETAHRPTDTPALLFYYIFEDYHSTYNLVARREHQYGAELDRLRLEMLQAPRLEHIDRLHHIGRQLGVLQLVYESYELLIDRLLAPQEPSLASLKNSKILESSGYHPYNYSDNDDGDGVRQDSISPDDSPSNSFHQPLHHYPRQQQQPPPRLQSLTPHASFAAVAGAGPTTQPGCGLPNPRGLLGVSLPSAARARFARLRARIRLYALSELAADGSTKEQLAQMVFALLALHESRSMERLTRVALLLSKVTILFLPVTLLTGVCGVQFVDQAWAWRWDGDGDGAGEFWKAFVGVLGGSTLFLIGFWVLGELEEGWWGRLWRRWVLGERWTGDQWEKEDEEGDEARRTAGRGGE